MADEDDFREDPDTALILGYLEKKLDPQDVAMLEQRARREQGFRAKLADLVLLQDLVGRSLGQSEASTRNYRRAQGMFEPPAAGHEPMIGISQ